MALKTDVGDKNLKQLAERLPDLTAQYSTFSWFGIKRYRTSPTVTWISSSMSSVPESVGRFVNIGGRLAVALALLDGVSFRIVLSMLLSG